MSSRSEVIETTVSKVADELVRRGLDPDDRVTITIEPDELIPGRREARACGRRRADRRGYRPADQRGSH
jgi:hypothetical protein